MIKDLLILTIFPGAMILAAATDLFTMTLPNRLALALVVCFFVVATLVGPRMVMLSGCMSRSALAALAVTLHFFSLGWIGGGDAKLFAATCLWFGPADDFRLWHLRRADRFWPSRSFSFSGVGCRFRAMLSSQSLAGAAA